MRILTKDDITDTYSKIIQRGSSFFSPNSPLIDYQEPKVLSISRQYRFRYLRKAAVTSLS